jgi:hypothetical protein
MLSRRKFLKIFGFATLAFSLLPTIFVGRSSSKSFEGKEAKFRVRNWLYGSPRRGCSTPDLAFECHGNTEVKLKDFENFHIPPEFAS